MSDGATTSAPARACESAALARSGRVASLSTSPSRMTPQCPWEVNSSRQTSVITRRSGRASLSRRIVSCTAAASSQASLPVSSLCWGSPKRMTAGTPSGPQLPCLGDGGVRRQALDAGERRNRLAQILAVPHEERSDEAIGRQARLAHQGAGGRGAAQAPQTSRRGIRASSADYCPRGAVASRPSKAAAAGKRGSEVVQMLETRLRLERAARGRSEDDGRRLAQPLRGRFGAAREEPRRRRGGSGAERGERPLEDLPVEPGVGGDGDFAVHVETCHPGAAGDEALRGAGWPHPRRRAAGRGVHRGRPGDGRESPRRTRRRRSPDARRARGDWLPSRLRPRRPARRPAELARASRTPSSVNRRSTVVTLVNTT